MGCEVYTPAVSATNTPEERDEQLLAEVRKILRKSGAEKVNLIGHCQGSPTRRYVAVLHSALVGFVTSVIVNSTNLIVELFMKLISLLSTKSLLPQDFKGSLKNLSTEGTNEFNKKYPQGLQATWGGQGKELETNGVYYYSWSGIIKQNAVNEGLNILYHTHAILVALGAFFKKERKQNNGLVGRYATHLGRVIGSDYQMDHPDVINQLAGAHPTKPDPLKLYLDHAARLHFKGL